MKAKFVFEKFTEDSDPIKDMGIGLDPAKHSNKYYGKLKEYKPNLKKTKGPGNRTNKSEKYDAGPGAILTIEDIVKQIKKEEKDVGYSNLRHELEKYLRVITEKSAYNLHGVYVYNIPLSSWDINFGHTPINSLNVSWDSRSVITMGKPKSIYLHVYQQIFLSKKDIERVLAEVENN